MMGSGRRLAMRIGWDDEKGSNRHIRAGAITRKGDATLPGLPGYDVHILDAGTYHRTSEIGACDV